MVLSNKIKEFFRNKKVLLVGLGILGGSGLSSTLLILKNQGKLTITDLKTKKELEITLKKLKKYDAKIKFVLGKHRKTDFLTNDIIVVNPAVPTLNTKTEVGKYLALAKKKNKIIENDISLFFKFVSNPIIAITGTRGKTTTTTWLGHILKIKYPDIFIGGNMPDKPALSFLSQIHNNSPLVLELSCFQLELLKEQAPHLAIITNLYSDHLNRYQTMKTYARVKANIFLKQTKDDYLILNYDNPWTKFFLSLKPQAQTYFISQKPLPTKLNGIYQSHNNLYFQNQGSKILVFRAQKFLATWGLHNLENLMCDILAANLLGLNMREIKQQINSLPQIPMRQEIIFQNKNLTIINDSAGTSPEAGLAILNRFTQKNLILITGGTDKNLSFLEFAKKIKEKILPQNLILLNGSATKKLIKELNKIHYSNYYHVFDNLAECLTYSLFLSQKKKKAIIAFSPSSASFEKFQNEFDRGKRFNLLVKQFIQ